MKKDMTLGRGGKQRNRFHPSVSHARRLPLLRRRRWSNHTGNQGVDPVAIVPASTAEEVCKLIEHANLEQLTVRAAGSGHSSSDATLTTGYLVLPERMTGAELAGKDREGRPLVRVKSGTTNRELNSFLDHHGLALSQMGGYDGQTIAGLISTSTHGSGITFGPFPDFVRSVDLVDGAGKLRRIEPEQGLTDRGEFEREHPEWELTQLDDWFQAVICGIGSAGVILALVIEVRERFELTEVRKLTRWDEVRRELEAERFRDYEHYEFYINPYARHGDGSNTCIVTTRVEEHRNGGPRHRPLIPELLGYLPWITAGVMQVVGALMPRLFPWVLDTSLRAIACPRYTNVSYKVFNIGSVNNLRAYSAEMAVPVTRAVEAIEAVLETADKYRREGAIYHTSPVAIRFVAPSRAMMSMMDGRETMTIELIQLVDTDGGVEILAAHEERLASLDVRPHWGQLNSLAPAELAGRYPRLADWEAIRAQLDPSGVFAGPFSKRVGLTSRGVTS